MDTATNKQAEPTDESPLVPGVDYDILTPEELAAELAQPDPASKEAWFIEAFKELPETITPEDHFDISPEEAKEILARLPDSFF